MNLARNWQLFSDYLKSQSASMQLDRRGADLLAALQQCVRPSTQRPSVEIPARQRVMGDWFLEGDLGFIHAPRGVGKTWMALGLATAIAGGRDFGPWASGGVRRVLYVDGEMPCEALDERIASMGGSKDLIVLNHEELFHLTGELLNFASPASQRGLTAYMLDRQISVVLLDNLSCLFSGVRENDADDWEAVLGWLLTLRRHRIAVVLVHHSGRNKDTMRGTSRREDAAFWVMRLDDLLREQHEGVCFRSVFTKDRNSSTEQYGLEWRSTMDDEGNIRLQSTSTSRMDEFRQWVADGLTGAEDIGKEMGLSKGSISRMAKKAMEAGWLTKRGREYALVP
ncbi:MAG: AAA family ATPase [Verrucomicrobia bacterium]|nr:AAA family ATPase [Verrucomicrobiota bacterium]